MMKKYKFYMLILFFICLLGVGMTNSKKALAKTGSGSCGKNAYWTYDTKSKKLEIFGQGKVTKEINVKKQMNRNRKYFKVEKLVIHEGITELKGDSVLKNVESLVKEVSLPDSFQKISRGLFDYFFVKNIYIPRNVSEIEAAAFLRMQPVVEKVTVSPENKYYCSKDDVLFTKNVSELVLYPMEKKNSSYHVPASVKKIAPLAFAGNRYLKSLKLPVDLKVLGGGAFYCCYELEQVNISELHKLKRIKDYCNYPAVKGFGYKEGDAYDECHGSPYQDSDSFKHLGTFVATNIRSFEMPDSLQYIATETFHDCEYLREFSIGKNFVGDINTGKEFTQKTLALYHASLQKLTVSKENKKYQMVDNILYTKDKKILCQVIEDKRYKKERLVLDKKTTEIANGAFRGISLYSDIIAEHDLDRIGISAFVSSKIRSFLVKGTVHRLMRGAFMFSDIQSFACEGGIGSIPANTFFECYSLEEIHIPSAVKEIGESAFESCSHLKLISFTNSVERVGYRAFDCCDSLEKLEFRNLKYIGEEAFNCQNLKELIIPESTVIDGKSAVSDWTKLIYIPSKEVVEQWKSIFSEHFLPHGAGLSEASLFWNFLKFFFIVL